MTSRYGSVSVTPKFVKPLIKAVALIVTAIILFNMFTYKVDGGNVCAVKTFGKATNEAGPGFHWKIPVVNQYACYNGRLQTLNVLMVEGTKSEATFDEPAIKGITNTSVAYDVSLSMTYILPTKSVRDLYNNVGRTNEEVFVRVVAPAVRTITRQVLNTHSADELYFGQLEQLSLEVMTRLKPELEKNGITVTFFGLKEFNFENSYEDKVRQKNQEVENKKLVVLQQETAIEEQKKLLIETNGLNERKKADAQTEADTERIKQQGIADGIESIGQAEANVLQSRATVINENPSLITWEQIGALRDANTIYLPSDTGILPILNLETGQDDIS